MRRSPPPPSASTAQNASVAFSLRTQALLHNPILPALLRLAWPNIPVMPEQGGAWFARPPVRRTLAPSRPAA